VDVPASWFANLPLNGNGEYTVVVRNHDGIKAFSDDTLLVHTGVDVLDFSPHAVYGPGDFPLTVAADGAVPGTVLQLNGITVPATVNTDGSLTATIHENGGSSRPLSLSSPPPPTQAPPRGCWRSSRWRATRRSRKACRCSSTTRTPRP
jgi:hypothetical protein